MTKTTKRFISKSKSIWGDTFDYSKTTYTGFANKITLICKTHGEFQQLVGGHLQHKNGCPKCNRKTKKTSEEFITEATAVWGDEFDYSKIVYINASQKVTIICNAHGEYQQIARGHLQGKIGCPVCKKKKFSQIRTKTTQDFISKASSLWMDKFDYSKTIYAGSDKKVTITCREHSYEFHQIASNHLRGNNGCPKCRHKYQNMTYNKNLKITTKD